MNDLATVQYDSKNCKWLFKLVGIDKEASATRMDVPDEVEDAFALLFTALSQVLGNSEDSEANHSRNMRIDAKHKDGIINLKVTVPSLVNGYDAKVVIEKIELRKQSAIKDDIAAISATIEQRKSEGLIPGLSNINRLEELKRLLELSINFDNMQEVVLEHWEALCLPEHRFSLQMDLFQNDAEMKEVEHGT